MAAIPSARTHEQIHHYFQLINPEIPEDRLRQCLEEHNYDTQRCEESLRKVSSQYLYQHPVVSHCPTLQTADMEGRSLSAHPSSCRRPQSHSVSGEPYSRGVPDGRSVSPSPAREGRGTPRHQKSSTWEDQPFPPYRYQPTPVWEKRDPLTRNVNPPTGIGRSVSHQPPSLSSRSNYDVGAWVLPEHPRREREEVSIQLNQPDLRRSPVPPDMVNPMQTQVLSPPADHQSSRPSSSPRISRTQRTPDSEEINANGKFSPMGFPWNNTASVTPQPKSSNEVCPLVGMGEQCAVSYQPLDPSKEELGDDDWIMVSPVVKSPQHITGTSSPVSPPVVHITGGKTFTKSPRDTQPKEIEHKSAPKDFSKEHTSSQKRKNDVKLKEKTYLQALLTHQKARFDLIQNRVEQARLDVEALRKEVSDMEGELYNKRTQMPSSFPTTEAISKLRNEKQGLLIDVECLQRDITLHLARQRETQRSDSFYQNIQPNNPYFAQQSRVRVPPHLEPSESPEDTETNKWSCKTCTFTNHEFLTECEMCQKPREERHPPSTTQHS